VLREAADDGEREGHDGPDEFEGALDGDAEQPERQEDQPDDGIEDERQDGDGPAQDEEDAPEQECEHERIPLH